MLFKNQTYYRHSVKRHKYWNVIKCRVNPIYLVYKTELMIFCDFEIKIYNLEYKNMGNRVADSFSHYFAGILYFTSFQIRRCINLFYIYQEFPFVSICLPTKYCKFWRDISSACYCPCFYISLFWSKLVVCE